MDEITAAYAVIDEYGSVQPGDLLPLGVNGNYTATIYLQASRHEDDADGRQYTITVYAHDAEGNERSAPARVIVPHGQGR